MEEGTLEQQMLEKIILGNFLFEPLEFPLQIINANLKNYFLQYCHVQRTLFGGGGHF